MISDINCKKCGKPGPERFAMLRVKTPTQEDVNREILYYECRCNSCGNIWKEKYLEA